MQKELFAAAPIASISDSFSQPKTSFLDRYRLSLRLDQMLVLMIGLLVVYILVFSFGVETGKRYSVSELRAERAKRERVTEELSRKIFENQQNSVVVNSALPVLKAETPVAAPVVVAKVVTATASAVVATTPSAEAPQASVKPTGKYTIQTVTVASKTVADRKSVV